MICYIGQIFHLAFAHVHLVTNRKTLNSCVEAIDTTYRIDTEIYSLPRLRAVGAELPVFVLSFFMWWAMNQISLTEMVCPSCFTCLGQHSGTWQPDAS